jgi:hypothetical protein
MMKMMNEKKIDNFSYTHIQLESYLCAKFENIFYKFSARWIFFLFASRTSREPNQFENINQIQIHVYNLKAKAKK